MNIKKTKKKKSFIDEYHQELIIILILFVVAWIFIAPYFFVNSSETGFKDTGVIGDTIGGITAPAIGLLSAFLIYFSFRAQIKANKKINKQIARAHWETNFIYLSSKYDKLREKFDAFHYIDKKDKTTINSLVNDLNNTLKVRQLLIEKEKGNEPYTIPAEYRNKDTQLNSGLNNYLRTLGSVVEFFDYYSSLTLSPEHSKFIFGIFYRDYILILKVLPAKWNSFNPLETSGILNEEYVKMFNSIILVFKSMEGEIKNHQNYKDDKERFTMLESYGIKK